MSHILMTSNSAWYLANFLGRTIQRLIDRGDHVTIVAPAGKKDQALVEMGCNFIPLALDPKGTSALADWKLLRSFIRTFKAQKPDVIMTFTIKNNIYGAFAARWLGIPVVPTISGLGEVFTRASLLRRFVTLLIRQSMKPLPITVFMNTRDRELLTSAGAIRNDRALLISSSGIDLTHFSPQSLPEGQPRVFLMLARLLWAKGIGEFVEAARRLKAEGSNIRCQLLGFVDVQNESAVDAETLKKWEKEGVLEFLGQEDDVRVRIKSAHCIVLPSYYPEGVPRSLLEGAAMARPIIATCTPGCEDTIDDGMTGYLCHPKNVDSLAEQMRKIAALPHAELSLMGQAGRKKMETEFDDGAVISAYISALDHLSRMT